MLRFGSIRGSKLTIEDTLTFVEAVSLGLVVGARKVNKFGHNGTVGTSEEVIWSPSIAFNYIVTAIELKLSSSNDTDVVDVTIEGLNENWLMVSDTKTLTGQTFVTTTNKYIRVFRMYITSANAALGDIYAGLGSVGSGIPSTIHAKIDIGRNQTLMAVYSIPADETGFILRTKWSSEITKANQVNLYIREFESVFRIKTIDDFREEFADHPFLLWEDAPAKSDIESRGVSSAGGGSISASFDMILIKTALLNG